MFTIMLIVTTTVALLIMLEKERQRRAKHRAQTKTILVWLDDTCQRPSLFATATAANQQD